MLLDKVSVTVTIWYIKNTRIECFENHLETFKFYTTKFTKSFNFFTRFIVLCKLSANFGSGMN